MSPGYSDVWATCFGYSAGRRPGRDDVVAIGRATAERVTSDFRGLMWDAVIGEVDPSDPIVSSFPAL